MQQGAPPLTSRILAIARVRQGLALLLLGLVAVVAAVLLTPSRFTPAIPDDQALGTLFSGTLKANRDYDILDPETTAEKREEAARSVWPVYDFDAGAAETLQRRISDAFAGGREALQQWKRQNPARAARLRPEVKLDSETYRFLLGERDEFWKALQALLDDDDYLELARSGFDPAVERATVRLAGLSAQGFMVEERGLLAADRERGIVVRSLGAALPEQAVRDIDRIQDLARSEAGRGSHRGRAVRRPPAAAPPRHLPGGPPRPAPEPRLQRRGDPAARRRRSAPRSRTCSSRSARARNHRRRRAGHQDPPAHLPCPACCRPRRRVGAGPLGRRAVRGAPLRGGVRVRPPQRAQVPPAQPRRGAARAACSSDSSSW